VAETVTVAETDSPSTVSTPPAHRWRRYAVNGVRIVLVLLILGFVARTTYQQWGEVEKIFRELSWVTIALALLATLAGIMANTMSWRAILTDIGHKVPVPVAARISLLGQLGKYLPGSVWMYVLQMELGKRAGLPRSRAFLASLIGMGIGVTVGLSIGTVRLRTAWAAANSAEHKLQGVLAFYGTLVLVPIALVCVHPKVLTKLVQLTLRILRRDQLERPLTWRGVLHGIGWNAIAYVMFGAQLWLFANAVDATPGFGGLLRCIGTMSLAMSLSVFIVIAPSGIGVREAIIAIGLLPFTHSFGLGFSLALVSRLIFTISDVVAAGAAALSSTRALKRAPAPADPDPDSDKTPVAAG